MENKANPGLRLIAFIIDICLILLFYQLLLLMALSSKTIQQILDSLLSLIIVVIVLNLIWPFVNSLLISTFGGTVGKLLTRTEVVTPEGEKISFWRAFFRNQIGYMVSGIFFWLGFIWIIFDKERRGWHDQIADTLVIVKNKIGWIIGLIAITFLLSLNIFLAFQNYCRATENLKFYKNLFTQAEVSI